MSPAATTRTGLVSLGIGLAAAGAGAVLGLAAERVAVGRALLPRPVPAHAGVAFGSVRSAPVLVEADDGTPLHVEVDEADRADPDGLTVVMSHGYALNLDSWHYQRLALRGSHRMVLWDQRGHGRSPRGRGGPASIDQLAADLAAVIRATAPTGPLVLVGHSMGGMAVMALAGRDRQLVADRVVGAALVSTSAGGLDELDFGLDVVGRAVRRAAPTALTWLSGRPSLTERGRHLGVDVEQVVVRRYSYAGEVPQDLVGFTATMIATTPIETLGDFLPAVTAHDERAALDALTGIETLVLTGDADLLIPPVHSEEIVAYLPHAEHVVVPRAGHLVMLEHPDVVNAHLLAFLERARRSVDRPGTRRRRRTKRS